MPEAHPPPRAPPRSQPPEVDFGLEGMVVIRIVEHAGDDASELDLQTASFELTITCFAQGS